LPFFGQKKGVFKSSVAWKRQTFGRKRASLGAPVIRRAAEMDQLVFTFIVFALGAGVGYGVREWKSQVRRRRYTF
jgi:hypothetical protein